MHYIFSPAAPLLQKRFDMKERTQSAINAEAAKAAEKDIHSSSIPSEIKLMVQMANSCQVVVEDVFNRVKGVYARHGFRPTNDNEILKGLVDHCDRIFDDETYGKLFRLLRKMPSRGVFSDEDIARFSNKGKR